MAPEEPGKGHKAHTTFLRGYIRPFPNFFETRNEKTPKYTLRNLVRAIWCVPGSLGVISPSLNVKSKNAKLAPKEHGNDHLALTMFLRGYFRFFFELSRSVKWKIPN